MQQPKKNCIEDENLHIIETLIKMEKYLGSNPNSNASMLKTKLVSYIAVLFSEPFSPWLPNDHLTPPPKLLLGNQ
jgi:hypothetical protein